MGGREAICVKIEPIVTERLRLRGITAADSLFAIGIWNDPTMGEYLPDEAMEEIDPEYLRMIEALGEDEECCYLIAEDKTTHERIGTCSFIPSGGVYDIAYCVHRDHQRQGYATEMAKGMADYAKSQGASALTIRVNKENTASNRVAEKLGCKIVGEKRYKKRGTDLEFADWLYELRF